MTYIFNDVAVVTDEEEGPGVGEVELHADQAWRRHHDQPLSSGFLGWNLDDSPSVCPGR